MRNDIIRFKETPMKPSWHTKSYNMTFNNNGDKFLSLTYAWQDEIFFIQKLGINGTSIISLRKDNFSDLVFTLMLVYSEKPVH